ncbi:MAG: hypothetical protein ABIJ08_01365 [Nanoarchaeota archaeon]
MENLGPYVIFGDLLYPAHSSARYNYIARATISGNESRIGLLDPIPLKDIEENDIFSKQEECGDYLDALLLGNDKDPVRFKDRIDTVEFVIQTIQFLKPGLELSIDMIAEDILKGKEVSGVDETRLRGILEKREEEIELTGVTVHPEAAIRNMAFPGQLFPPRDSSLLLQALNYNAVYVNDGWVHVLRTAPKEGSDRIHINGMDFFWSRRFENGWVEEDYIRLIQKRLRKGLKQRVGEVLKVYSEISGDKKKYAQIAELDSFQFQDVKVRWMGGKAYITLERGPFARQDYEFSNKWHKRDGFEIGGAFYYSNGNMYFSVTPVVVADYKDVAFYTNPLGMFRTLCSRDKSQWNKFPKTPEGAAGYIRQALDIYYNGFSPESVREHVGGFGDGMTYRKICPLENALTANSLKEVRAQEVEPVGVHIPLK